MKKKWLRIIALLLVLVVLVAVPIPVLANDDAEETADVNPTPETALATQAPRRASPGEEITLMVYQRGTEDPVKDADIWALTRENAEAMKAEIEAAKAEGTNVKQELDWESMMGVYGFFLGTTNGSGKLKYTFEEEGVYRLLALKDGFIPGRAGIAIKTPPVALAIEVLRSETANQEEREALRAEEKEQREASRGEKKEQREASGAEKKEQREALRAEEKEQREARRAEMREQREASRAETTNQ